MKRLLVLIFTIATACFFAPRASAQDHVEIGAFADYFRWHALEKGRMQAHSNLRVTFGPTIRF